LTRLLVSEIVGRNANHTCHLWAYRRCWRSFSWL